MLLSPIEMVCVEYGYIARTDQSLMCVNPLPDVKILDLSRLKAFADGNLNVYQKLTLTLGIIENIVGKGENAGYQHFLLFPQCFHKGSFLGL